MPDHSLGRPPSAARSAPCPKCHAAMGEPCIGRDGEATHIYHVARKRAAGLLGPRVQRQCEAPTGADRPSRSRPRGKARPPAPDELARMERLVSAAKALIEAHDLGTGPRRIARARDVSAFAGATIRPVWTRRQPAAMAKMEEALADPAAGLARLRAKIRRGEP